MDEAIMLKAALVVALVGLACLIALLKFGGMEESSLVQAKALEDGSSVKIIGVADKVMTKEGLTRITLTKEESVEVVLFKSINITPGIKLEVRGQVQEYKGKNEVLADKITII